MCKILELCDVTVLIGKNGDFNILKFSSNNTVLFFPSVNMELKCLKVPVNLLSSKIFTAHFTFTGKFLDVFTGTFGWFKGTYFFVHGHGHF